MVVVLGNQERRDRVGGHYTPGGGLGGGPGRSRDDEEKTKKEYSPYYEKWGALIRATKTKPVKKTSRRGVKVPRTASVRGLG